ncbi:hypothetical protein B0H14DRAFT_2645288 [Mycena olivaceomarginata]|nr:hypothetical protein B0H14DRAFT_2645288 [Mycena olivaceomarginata]
MHSDAFDAIPYADIKGDWKKLGAGSFGNMFKGTYLGIDVAIKEVLPSTEYDVAKYFEREWRLVTEKIFTVEPVVVMTVQIQDGVEGNIRNVSTADNTLKTEGQTFGAGFSGPDEVGGIGSADGTNRHGGDPGDDGDAPGHDDKWEDWIPERSRELRAPTRLADPVVLDAAHLQAPEMILHSSSTGAADYPQIHAPSAAEISPKSSRSLRRPDLSHSYGPPGIPGTVDLSIEPVSYIGTPVEMMPSISHEKLAPLLRWAEA